MAWFQKPGPGNHFQPLIVTCRSKVIALNTFQCIQIDSGNSTWIILANGHQKHKKEASLEDETFKTVNLNAFESVWYDCFVATTSKFGTLAKKKSKLIWIKTICTRIVKNSQKAMFAQKRELEVRNSDLNQEITKLKQQNNKNNQVVIDMQNKVDKNIGSTMSN